MANFDRVWTAEKVEKLRHEAITHSASQLGIMFNTTRNAISGICYRHGIRIKGGRDCSHIERKPRDKPLSSRQFGALSVNFKKHSRKLPSERKIKHAPVQWPTDGCLQVIGEPRNLIGCGLERVSGEVYCQRHCRENYQVYVKKQ